MIKKYNDKWRIKIMMCRSLATQAVLIVCYSRAVGFLYVTR